MTLSEPVVYYDSVQSTQDEARRELTGIHWTSNQTAGRGRFDRLWHAELESSLAVSIALPDLRDHPRPYLIGMWLGLALADLLDTQIQWPNDLVIGGKKVCGILTEVVDQVPIVGIGINIGPMNFPKELAVRATSLVDSGHPRTTPLALFEKVIAEFRDLPDVPDTWQGMEEKWYRFDATEGKIFRTQSGKMGIAKGLSSSGELVLETPDGETTVSVAEALWGAN